jgi:ubiquinone/menaquinone biosynthesis C-methylase UbiE
LAWDVGTGNGQAAVLLASHFDSVLATDPSERQLAEATPHPRVTYRLGREDESGLEGASVDLVTVAQALHWFDLDRFYAEANRVLAPGGAIAVWCYEKMVIDSTVDPHVGWFYSERVGQYWPPARHHVETGYRHLPFPFESLRVGEHAIERSMTRSEYLGYVGTWSSVVRCIEAEGRDPVHELEARLQGVWPAEERRLVRWPISVRAGRRSKD